MSLVSTARRIKFEQSAKSALRNLYANAKRFCWTQSEIQEYIKTSIYTGDWERVGSLVQATIFGYNSALMDTHRDSLEIRYNIRGKWYLPREVSKTDDTEYAEATVENCHYVYCVNTPAGPEYRRFS